VRLAVEGQEPDGVGVSLDGSGALVLGFQRAAEASVEGQEVPSRQRTAHGCGLCVRHVFLTLGCRRAAGSGQRAPVSRVRGRRHPC
jgi:hypothetical protein